MREPLEIPGNRSYLTPAQFRTCLWPRAGRWASGQEAGQPPGTWVRSRGDWISPRQGPRRKPRPEQRPAAGGETGAPRAQRGTRLKATTERAFLVSAGSPSAGVTEEALHLAGRAERVSRSKRRQRKTGLPCPPLDCHPQTSRPEAGKPDRDNRGPIVSTAIARRKKRPAVSKRLLGGARE